MKTGLIWLPATVAQAQLASVQCRRKAYRSTASAETPATYSGLIRWYRSSDLSLNDNDPVSTWVDQSSSALNATAVLGARPTFKTNIVDGKPVLRFDGNDDDLSFVTTTFVLNSESTQLTVMKPGAAAGVYTGSAGAGFFFNRRAAQNDVRIYDTGSAFVSSAFTGAVTDLQVVSVRHTSGHLWQFRENKTDKGSSASSSAAINFADVGAGGGGGYFTGDILEFMIWDKSLSDANLDSLYDNYFKSRYPSLP